MAPLTLEAGKTYGAFIRFSLKLPLGALMIVKNASGTVNLGKGFLHRQSFSIWNGDSR